MNLNSLLDFIEIPKEIFSETHHKHILFVSNENKKEMELKIIPVYTLNKIDKSTNNYIKLASINEVTDEDLIEILIKKITSKDPLPIMFKESVIDKHGKILLEENFNPVLRSQMIMQMIERIKKEIYQFPLDHLMDLQDFDWKKTKQKGLDLCIDVNLRKKIEKALSLSEDFMDQELNLSVLLDEELSNLMIFYEDHQELNKRLDEASRKIMSNDFIKGINELSQLYFHCSEEIEEMFFIIEDESDDEEN